MSEAENAELEEALKIASAEELGERACDAAVAGEWFAAAVLAVGAWRKENGHPVVPDRILIHVGLAFGRHAKLTP